MLLWAWIILDSRVRSVLVPEITDGEFINECVREHNRARSSVSPPASNMLYMVGKIGTWISHCFNDEKMFMNILPKKRAWTEDSCFIFSVFLIQSWDAGLAITAKAWARHCMFKHNVYLEDVRRVHPTFSSVGENIWMGSQSLFNVTFAVKRWVDEKANYNYQSRTCTDVCGHYTQVCIFTVDDFELILCRGYIKKGEHVFQLVCVAQLNPPLIPGCVGKQLQGWLCRPAVHREKCPFCLQLCWRVSWTHLWITPTTLSLWLGLGGKLMILNTGKAQRSPKMLGGTVWEVAPLVNFLKFRLNFSPNFMWKTGSFTKTNNACILLTSI